MKGNATISMNDQFCPPKRFLSNCDTPFFSFFFFSESEVLVARLCPTLCNPVDCSLPGSCVHGIMDKNSGVGCHSLLQGIFSTQGWNLGLQHCGQILCHLSHQGSPLFKYS